MIEFGRRLRAVAISLDLSDSEVARRAGLSERRYGHYVTGAREPDFATLLRICSVLQCSPNELLGWDGLPKPKGREPSLRRLQAAANHLSASQLEMVVTQIEALARTGPRARGRSKA